MNLYSSLHLEEGMVVTVGETTCEIAVLCKAEIVFHRTLLAGVDMLDEYISAYLLRVHHLVVVERVPEEIRVGIGSAWPLEHGLYPSPVGPMFKCRRV